MVVSDLALFKILGPWFLLPILQVTLWLRLLGSHHRWLYIHILHLAFLSAASGFLRSVRSSANTVRTSACVQ